MKNSNGKFISANYFWISIEGTDAVGKTKLLKEVEKYLKKQTKVDFAIVKEFSDFPFGNLIKKVIKKKEFFCLGEEFHYPFAETLLLCGDFISQFEKILLRNSKGKKLLIISDRGLYSFLTYQLLRIKSQYRSSIKIRLEKWIKNIFKPIGKPHFVILLTSPINQIKHRIIERDGSINRQELYFIEKVQKEYRKILKNAHQPFITLENRNGQFENVKRKTLQQIKEILIKEKKA